MEKATFKIEDHIERGIQLARANRCDTDREMACFLAGWLESTLLQKCRASKRRGFYAALGKERATLNA